jgi:hypothetical protein
LQLLAAHHDAPWASGMFKFVVGSASAVTVTFRIFFFLESTFKDQINPKRQTAFPPEGGPPELDLVFEYSSLA